MSPVAASTGSPWATAGAASSETSASAAASSRRGSGGRVLALRLGRCFLHALDIAIRGCVGCGRGRLDPVSVQGAREHGFRGAQQHRHVAALRERPLLDDRQLLELRGEALEDRLPALGVRDLAPAEHDRDLDLVLVLEEALDVRSLGGVVVLGDLRPELDLADRDLLLVLACLLGLLGQLVLVLGVVQDATDRGTRLRGHLDEVEVALLGDGERLLGRHDPDLLALLVDEPHLRDADALVDPGRVAFRRTPVEPTRDRHSELELREELGQRRPVYTGHWAVCERSRVSRATRSANCATVTAPVSPWRCSRTATCPDSASRSPRTSM